MGDLKTCFVNGGMLALYALPFGAISKPAVGMTTPLCLSAASASIISHGQSEELEPSDDNLDDFDETPTALNNEPCENYDKWDEEEREFSHLKDMAQVAKDFVYADRDPNNRGGSEYNRLAREQEATVFETDPEKLGISAELAKEWPNRR